MLFKEVIGQKEVKNRILDMVNSGRIPHNILFNSKQGSGGLPMALALVQFLFCENKTQDACGICANCKKISKGIHPDVNFMFPVATSPSVKEKPLSDNYLLKWRDFILQNPYGNINDWCDVMDIGTKQPNINVHQAREIQQKLNLKSFEGNYKIALIWMVELMNTSTANKLLKLLEEPPDKTIFILIAENTETILPTVLSRTQQIIVRGIDTESLTNFIAYTNGIIKEKANEVAIMADGSLREALQLMVEGQKEKLIRESFIQWMRLVVKRDVPAILDWCDNIHNNGREWQKQFFKFSLHIFRECMIWNLNQGEILRTKGQEKEFVSKFAQFVPLNNLEDVLELISAASYSIERNSFAKLVFADLSFEMIKIIKR